MDKPRVAVIAIHGVGDHQQFEMARSIADLLENLSDGPRQPRYSPFIEETIRLNVAPVKVTGHRFATPQAGEQPQGPDPSLGPMHELYASRFPVRPSAASAVDSLDHLFMEGQLAAYLGEGPQDTYEFLRVRGERVANAPVGVEQDAAAAGGGSDKPPHEVHIYDMFWSDLSGVGTAGLRIFGELYQVLFHLAEVGLNNVRAAAASAALRETAAAPAWRGFATAQFCASTMLGLPIPLLNLILLAFSVAAVAVGALTRLTAIEKTLTVTVILLTALTAAWGWGLLRKGEFSMIAFSRPVVTFLVVTALAFGGANWFSPKPKGEAVWSERAEWGCAAIVLAAAFTGVWQLCVAYERRRPGARKALFVSLALVAALAAPAAIFWRLALPWSDFQAIGYLLRAAELTCWALVFCWALFWCIFVWAHFAGDYAVWKTGQAVNAEKDRAARTRWTARVTLALPAVVFLLVTFAGWAGVATVALPMLPHGPLDRKSDCDLGSIRSAPTAPAGRVCYVPVYPPDRRPDLVPNWAWWALFRTGFGYIPLLLLLVVVAGVITIWGLAPSVWSEISPPRGARAANERSSIALGDWLESGYKFMRWSGRLIYVGACLVPLMVIGAWLPDYPWLTVYADKAGAFQQVLGGIVAGAGLGVLGFGGRLSKLALGFRPIVRISLDVDNWLREHPRNANPTARICGRYVSLLRYICQWKGADGRGYDHLIVFGHSQGTVITADLLRFLRAEAEYVQSYAAYDPSLSALDKLPVTLFTAGCPLRQLYGLRFPYLYGYAPPEPGGELMPKPEDLGAGTWVNVYRTGDYIGRYLWREQPWELVAKVQSRTWDPVGGIPKNIWQRDGRVEFSLGPGAHTHYWDSTAEPVAETLDALIARAPTKLR